MVEKYQTWSLEYVSLSTYNNFWIKFETKRWDWRVYDYANKYS